MEFDIIDNNINDGLAIFESELREGSRFLKG